MNVDDIKNVLVVGAGTIGLEVAISCARHGYRTTVFDNDPSVVEAAGDRVAALALDVARHGHLTADEVDRARSLVRLSLDAAAAAETADLMIECVHERLPVKRAVFARFDELCPKRTILTTNSSYFVPSFLARATRRAERVAALHFHSPPWVARVADVMPHATTDPAVVEALSDFARRLRQIPIVVRREHHGYVFNSMLRQLLMSALTLVEQGVVDFDEVDRAWMGVTRMGIGPFGMIDRIGLDTVHEIVTQWSTIMRDPQGKRNAELLARRVAEGRLGLKRDGGFYDYPHPRYEAADFLDGEGLITPNTNGRSVAAGSPHGEREIDDARVTRYELASTLAPLPASDPCAWPWSGGAWVLGDNGVAEKLAQRLRAAGMDVTRVPAELAGQALKTWLEWRLSSDVPTVLCLVPSWDHAERFAYTRSDWEPRRRACVERPYTVCQRWYTALAERGVLANSALVAATLLGGDFGARAARVAAVESAGLTSLTKAIFLESRAMRTLGPVTRVVDFSSAEAHDRVAELLVDELRVAAADSRSARVEEAEPAYQRIGVAHHRGRRYAAKLRHAPLESRREPRVTRGGAWLVTGGARGITAVVARAFARRFGTRLHLIGGTPLAETPFEDFDDRALDALRRETMIAARARSQKPNEAWDAIARQIEVRQNTARLTREDIAWRYHACDLRDDAAVSRTLEAIRAEEGSIRGILHGAGVEASARLERKDWPAAERTFAAKVDGLVTLLERTADDPLEAVIGFGSMSGRFGGVAQADYAMANELLAKLLAAYRGHARGVDTVTFHWPPWDEVGMAARPASRRQLELGNIRFVTVDQGAAFVVDEVAAGLPAAEVVVMAADSVPRGILLPRDKIAARSEALT